MLKVDISDALRSVGRLKEVVEHPGPFLQIIAEELYRVARRSFERESAPEGQRWIPLSLKYAAQKSRLFPGRGILRRQGRLVRSLRRGVQGRVAFATAGPLAYAAIHQFGGRAGRKGRARIPARPYLGFPPESQERVGRDIERAAKDFFDGRI